MKTEEENRQVAQRQLNLLKSYSKELPSCYKDFNEFLYDFFPDFDWSEVCRIQAKYVLENPEFKNVSDSILSNHGYNIKNALVVFTIPELDEDEIVLSENGDVTKGNKIFEESLALFN